MKILVCPKCESLETGEGVIYSLPRKYYIKCNKCANKSGVYEDIKKARREWTVQIEEDRNGK